jgi:2-dehydrotetronate isomerase
VLFNAPAGNWQAGERGNAAVPGREEEFRSGLERALEYARALACPRLHSTAGLASDGSDRGRMRAVYLANLAWAAERARPEGIDILIEPIALRNVPGYFLNRQDEAHAIVAEIGAPNLKILMDLFHCQVAEGDLATKIRKYLADPTRVGHFQIAGVPERHEPDSGEVNDRYLFDLIDQLGFQGWIGCEYTPRAGTTAGLGWINRRQSVVR